MSSALARLLPASIEQALDAHAVARPLLDLVEVAVVRIERVARLLIRPAAHRRVSRTVGVARPYHVTADAGGRFALPPSNLGQVCVGRSSHGGGPALPPGSEAE
jgi:hypothetical protein